MDLAASRPTGTQGAVPPVSTLAVLRLVLTNFRSYASAELDLDTRPVVLTGPNGAGKTNILEAISLLTPGRGLRGAKLGDVARYTDPSQMSAARSWAVAATVRHGEDDVKIGTGLQGSSKRSVRIDGKTMPGASALASIVRVSWLTPAMDRLFVETPGGRRRFLDRLVLSEDPKHATHAGAYEHAMRERQRLLKEGVRDPNWFEALENAMAVNGQAMAQARNAFIERWKDAIDQASGGLVSAFPKADIYLEGGADIETTEGFARQLAGARERDAAAGRALIGPHRCDLIVHHREKRMPARDCSTGEQKALLIGLVLAAARLRKERDGHAPILLLDEVAAHLDSARRCALFDEICALGSQAWMTGTDFDVFAPFGDRARYLAVAESAVRSQ